MRVTSPLCREFTGHFPSQTPVTRSFDVFFDLPLKKRLSKQSICRWFQMPSYPLCRHCNVIWLIPVKSRIRINKSQQVLRNMHKVRVSKTMIVLYVCLIRVRLGMSVSASLANGRTWVNKTHKSFISWWYSHNTNHNKIVCLFYETYSIWNIW